MLDFAKAIGGVFILIGTGACVPWVLARISGRKLEDALTATKIIRVHGVRFKIRKINPLDYLQGSKAIQQVFETHQKAVATVDSVEITNHKMDSIKDHFSDVFLAAVVEPKLKRKAEDEGDGVPVAHLFTDWALANELYTRIVAYTYGKKNLRFSPSSATAASKST